MGSIPGDPQLQQAVWNATGTAILVASPDGTICQVNAELERLFGYRSGQLIGQPVEVLLPVRLREAHARHREGYMSAPVAQPMGTGRDLIGLRADGSEVPVEVGLQPVSTDAGLLVLVSVNDTSNRLRATAEHDTALERQYAFEQFIAGLSFRLIDVSDRQLPEAVAAGLGEMCQRLGLDRAVCYGLDDHAMPDVHVDLLKAGSVPRARRA